jgi:hypothetical protein
MKRWGVIVALAAATQLLVAGTAHAQASWPPPPAYYQPPPIMGPRVILRADNPNVRLQQHTQLRWRDVCLAPCGTTVDPSALYRVGGGTAIASDPFPLPRAAGDVYVDASVGSKVKRYVGLGLSIGGLVAGAYGLLFWSIANDSTYSSSPYDNGGANDVARNFGLFFFAVAAVLEGVGLPLLFSSTSVQVR